MHRQRGLFAAVAVPVAVISGCGGSPKLTPTAESQVVPTPAHTLSVANAGLQFTMPDEVGKTLPVAQADLQRVSGNPLYFTTTSDARGKNRYPIVATSWKVCSTSVKAGQTVDASTTTIDIALVKTTEQCP
jgi:hypothetical protein